MSLSVNRLRRPNAGSKMSELLDTEEVVDTFYHNIYGGFEEDDNDIDYTSADTDSEDVFDSDFSIDENDEPISDDQNDEEFKRKTKIKTKFAFNKNNKSKGNTIKPKSSLIEKSFESEVRVPLEIDIPSMEKITSRKRLRICKKRSISSEKIIENRLKFAEQMTKEIKNLVKVKNCAKEWTQKELLEESVNTEELNLQSLKEYEKLMSEKDKKSKISKHCIKGPFIRFHSVSMPLIQELNDKRAEGMAVNASLKQKDSYSRTFVTFSDDKTYDSLFNSSVEESKRLSAAMVCPVTQLPARYFDPISQLPFANTEAFNQIRNQYYKQLEIYGNINQIEVKKWIDWRHENEDKWSEWQKNHLTYDSSQMTTVCESQNTKTKVESICKPIDSLRQKHRVKQIQSKMFEMSDN